MRAAGARAVHLGSRVLRSETAPLAVLSAIGVLVEAPQGV
jgi:16S rRNA U1498 N3-methylase RsmE